MNLFPTFLSRKTRFSNSLNSFSTTPLFLFDKNLYHKSIFTKKEMQFRDSYNFYYFLLRRWCKQRSIGNIFKILLIFWNRSPLNKSLQLYRTSFSIANINKTLPGSDQGDPPGYRGLHFQGMENMQNRRDTHVLDYQNFFQQDSLLGLLWTNGKEKIGHIYMNLHIFTSAETVNWRASMLSWFKITLILW